MNIVKLDLSMCTSYNPTVSDNKYILGIEKSCLFTCLRPIW